MEYFLIGSSLLNINQKTGIIEINGILDAENEQSLTFFCYAHDMADTSFRKQSPMVKFTINIVDVNEFEPILMTDMNFLTIHENDLSVTRPASLGTVTCYDHDITSSLTLTIDSISYVIAGKRIVHESLKTKAYIENLFELNEFSSNQTFVNDKEQSTKSNKQKLSLVLNDLVDYEQLFRPNESLVEVEISCKDGLFENKAFVLLKFVDENDNTPEFTHSFQNVIEISETTDFMTSLAKLEAHDSDLSREFGNESLVFTIGNCTPSIYEFSVKFGHVYSNTVLDADTDEMIEQRRRDYETSPGLFKDSIDIDCRVQVADMLGDTQASLSSQRDLKIIFVNLNDNAPVIKLSTKFENTIEVEEGVKTQGKILAQIEVFDRDGASGLRCLFGNELTIHEVSVAVLVVVSKTGKELLTVKQSNSFYFLTILKYFEFKTERDRSDPFKAWCILKVQNDRYISYDATKQSYYLFDLVVTDNKFPPIGTNKGLSRAQIKVHILAVNNKPPMFLGGDEETFIVFDSARNGTVVGTIQATDLEDANPEKLIYVLNSTNSTNPNGISDKFELVNKASAFHWGSVELVTKAKLNGKESPYRLVVTAYDGPIHLESTRSSMKLLIVNVLNQGTVSTWSEKETGKPVGYYMKMVEEEQPAGTLVVTVNAVVPSFNKKDVEDVEILYEIETNEIHQNASVIHSLNENSRLILKISFIFIFNEKSLLIVK